MASGDVRIIKWPAERDALAGLDDGAPRLILVDDDSEPPEAADCCQDWMWRTGSERELRVRLRHLAQRALGHGQARPRVDDIGMIHVGLRSVHLAPKEAALARVLVERFDTVVSRQDLVRAGWPEGIQRANVLASRIAVLRTRISSLGLDIRVLSGRGYAMRARSLNGNGNGNGNSNGNGNGAGFEDELDTRRLLEPS